MSCSFINTESKINGADSFLQFQVELGPVSCSLIFMASSVPGCPALCPGTRWSQCHWSQHSWFAHWLLNFRVCFSTKHWILEQRQRWSKKKKKTNHVALYLGKLRLMKRASQHSSQWLDGKTESYLKCSCQGNIQQITVWHGSHCQVSWHQTLACQRAS